jgi:hypothetical protein
MTEQEFKEKARRLLFNSHLNVFPTVFEMYTRTFKLEVDLDEAMGQVISIVRTSADTATAYDLVCHYLDSLE